MKGKNLLRIQEPAGQNSDDTYMNKAEPKDRSFCRKCKAIYHNKHWFFDDRALDRLKSNGSHPVLCPSCQKIEDHYATGILTLKGGFLKNHGDEILNLIKNEERRAMGLNPLERIIDIHPKGETWLVTTTHEKLAQKLGRKLFRAFSGKVAYQWSRGAKMARVEWVREI